jgi:hypothetical protein
VDHVKGELQEMGQTYWTKQRITEAMFRWKREFGIQPMAADWLRALPKGFPSASAVRREFGNWSSACQEVGLCVNEMLKPTDLEMEPRTLEQCLELIKKYSSKGVAPPVINPLRQQFLGHKLTWIEACELTGLSPWTPTNRRDNKGKEKAPRPRYKFDHEEARRLYRLGQGAGIEAMAKKFGVSEQAIRYAVIPGEKERMQRTGALNHRRQKEMTSA